MTTVIVSKNFDLPSDALWAAWADFGNVYTWHPFVEKSRLVDGTDGKIRVGTRRQCDLVDGKNWVREEIVAMDEGRQLKIDLYDGTMPIKAALATITIAPLSESRTRVDVRMDFQPKFGVLGRLMAPLMKRQFTHMFTELLAANGKHVKTLLERKTPAPTASNIDNAPLLASH